MKEFNSKNMLFNILVVIMGVLSGIAVFAIVQTINHKREVSALIPNAKKALEDKQYSAAITYYQKAEKEFPDDINIRRQLADLFLLKGKYDEAINYYKSIPQAQLTEIDIEKYGDAYFQKENYQEALKIWKGHKLSAPATYNLANIYYKNGQLGDYIAELNKIKNTKEGLILSQVNENDLNKILENANKALTLTSITKDKINAESFKAQIENAKNQKDYGKESFAELIQISAFTDLEQCKFLFDRISSLRQSLDSQKIPTFQLDYYQGVCNNEIEEPDKAIPLLESAINSDTTIIEYREALAKSYFLKKDVENLKKTYDDILVLKKDVVYYNNYAFYLYELDKFDDAIAKYTEALKLTTDESAKKNIALTITQINLLDKKDLNICNNNEIINFVISQNTLESDIIKKHCEIYLNRYQNSSNNDVLTNYFNALAAKEENKINRALDKDADGMLTSYYKAVGMKLISN